MQQHVADHRATNRSPPVNVELSWDFGRLVDDRSV